MRSSRPSLLASKAKGPTHRSPSSARSSPRVRRAAMSKRRFVVRAESGACERCLKGEDVFCRNYRILGENTQGGYTRHFNVPDANLLPKPKKLSFEEAAALPLCFLTAWQMVVEKAQVEAGQTVLVQAAG